MRLTRACCLGESPGQPATALQQSPLQTLGRDAPSRVALYGSGTHAPTPTPIHILHILLAFLLRPIPIGNGGHAVLERHTSHNLPRMRIVAGSRFDEAAVRDTQAFMTRVLKLCRPFSVEWDTRNLQWPTYSPAMMRAVHEWVEVHVQAWDQYVQAHAVIVSNPIARSFTRWLVLLFLPPQVPIFDPNRPKRKTAV